MKSIADGINKKMLEISRVTEQFKIPESVKKLIEITEKFQSSIPIIEVPKIEIPKFNLPEFEQPDFSQYFNSEFLQNLEKFSRIAEQANNSPELQFALISDLEALNINSTEDLKESLIRNLTDGDIERKEELLNKNLLPLLENVGLDSLWNGANIVLESKDNPDRLRHCLVSLRTILEFLIDEKLAPMRELKDSEMFTSKFKRYHLGKQKLNFIKIKREEKIEYFTSKFEYGYLEEFTKNEVQYVCNCYSILCNLHQPDIGISENQVRSLKVKTGITLWLLLHLYGLLEPESTTHNKASYEKP